ncbi:hypothetical protein IC582_030109 [Cucumis melo]
MSYTLQDVVYCSFLWMLHVIDLRENCVYVLDSLRSKINEDIHGVINVCWMIVFAVVLYGSVEKCASILVLDLMHCRCLLLVFHGWQDVLFDICDYIYKWIYWRIWSSWTYSVEYSCFYMEVYVGILGIIVCIAGELVIRH